MTEDLIKTYSGYAAAGVFGFFAFWSKLSKTRADASGDDLRRASDESMRETMKELRKDLQQEVTRRTELENRERALIEIVAEKRFQNKEHSATIGRLRERIKHLNDMMDEIHKNNPHLRRAFSNTDIAPLE